MTGMDTASDTALTSSRSKPCGGHGGLGRGWTGWRDGGGGVCYPWCAAPDLLPEFDTKSSRPCRAPGKERAGTPGTWQQNRTRSKEGGIQGKVRQEGEAAGKRDF